MSSTVIEHYCSAIDSVFPFVIQHWILCFRCDSSKQAAVRQILEDGLAATTKQMPFLSGHVTRETRDGVYRNRLKITYDAQAGPITLHHRHQLEPGNDQVVSYADFTKHEMPIAKLFPDDLFPRLSRKQLRERPLSAQVTFFDGGCILGVCLHHSVFDGQGAGRILGAWAANCRMVSHGSTEIPESIDNAKAHSVRLDVPDGLESKSSAHGGRLDVPEGLETTSSAHPPTHASWQALGLQHPGQHSPHVNLSLPQQETESALFGAAASDIEMLRNTARAEFGQSISSFDITAAMIWQSAVRARAPDLPPDPNSVSRLRIPINVRSSLGISQDYLGNVLLHNVSSETISALTVEQRLGQLASRIAQDKKDLRAPENVRAAVALSHAMPELDERKPLFSTTMGADVVLTSWQDIPFYLHDWGSAFGASNDGRADYFRIPHRHLPGLCAIMPARPGGEVVEVLVSSVPRRQIERMQEDVEFSRLFRRIDGIPRTAA